MGILEGFGSFSTTVAGVSSSLSAYLLYLGCSNMEILARKPSFLLRASGTMTEFTTRPRIGVERSKDLPSRSNITNIRY